MRYDIKLAILLISIGSIAIIGWLGYWTEYQNRVKLQKEIKRFYNGPEKKVKCVPKYQPIIKKILFKARKITNTRIF